MMSGIVKSNKIGQSASKFLFYRKRFTDYPKGVHLKIFIFIWKCPDNFIILIINKK